MNLLQLGDQSFFLPHTVVLTGEEPLSNPKTNRLFVNATDIPWIFKLTDLKQIRAANQLNPEILFRTYCSNCHGADKKGSGVGPDFDGACEKIQKRADRKHLKKKVLRRCLRSNFYPNSRSPRLSPTLRIPLRSNHLKPLAFLRMTSRLALMVTIFIWTLTVIPAIEPPFGTMTAIDLNTGDIIWQVPLGEDPQFKKMGIPNSGMFNRGGGIATAGGLIFIGATGDNMIRAFDQLTGKVLWEHQLPGMASSIPSTYAVGGKQYVVVSVNGEQANNFKGGYIAFALP
jgi:quinoprotein glucose dehydrogenase